MDGWTKIGGGGYVGGRMDGLTGEQMGRVEVHGWRVFMVMDRWTIEGIYGDGWMGRSIDRRIDKSMDR